MRVQRVKKMAQAGFTLVELIVVIVILGILAAVAIPKLTTTSDSAYISVQDATLGALKSAWSIAYAKKKGSPTITEITGEMTDPTCTPSTASISCANVFQKDGTTLAVFGVTADSNGVVTSPSLIVAPTTR